MWILRKYGNYLEESIAFAPNKNISIAIISIIEYYPIVILSFISAPALPGRDCTITHFI